MMGIHHVLAFRVLIKTGSRKCSLAYLPNRKSMLQIHFEFMDFPCCDPDFHKLMSPQCAEPIGYTDKLTTCSAPITTITHCRPAEPCLGIRQRKDNMVLSRYPKRRGSLPEIIGACSSSVESASGFPRRMIDWSLSTMEGNMPAALSMDLRERVAAATMKGMTARAAAKRFGISVSPAIRIGRHHAPVGNDGGHHRSILEGRARKWLLVRLALKPDLTMRTLTVERRPCRSEPVTRTWVTRSNGGQYLDLGISFETGSHGPVHGCPGCKRYDPDSRFLSMSCVMSDG